MVLKSIKDSSYILSKSPSPKEKKNWRLCRNYLNVTCPYNSHACVVIVCMIFMKFICSWSFQKQCFACFFIPQCRLIYCVCQHPYLVCCCLRYLMRCHKFVLSCSFLALFNEYETIYSDQIGTIEIRSKHWLETKNIFKSSHKIKWTNK